MVLISTNPFLFSGTKVVDGYACMLATSVGMNTTWEQMMSHISRDTSEETPLQARLNKLTSSIGKVGLAVAFLVLVVLLVHYFTGNTTNENGNQEYNGSKTKTDDTVILLMCSVTMMHLESSNNMWRNLHLLTLQYRGESIFGLNEKVKDTTVFNIFLHAI
ncbi:hypothetical protein LWI29_010749 [Acer saccharum]|uniref:Uncharacterized protein n=1 Tax=Acer saccharum TaxID=4024 RepID=A0AA39TJX9_ACESA|nr:hypothetical protein LWI29_010749 [Acer saccharum]